MSRRLMPLLALLVACLLGGGLLYVYLNATPYEETVDRGPSPQARANPYLAAEIFLRQRGLQVHHANGLEVLATLKPEQHSLLLLGERTNMTPRQVEQVLDWARAGGRLLFVAEALWNEEAGRSGDLLLDRLNVRQFLSKDLKAPAPEATREPYPKLTKLYLEDEEAPAYIGFDTAFHLEDPDNLAQSWANSALATHMMQLGYGQGSITVLTDAEIWKTPFIAKHDNAWLLWYLSADSDVTLLFDTDHDSLWSLLLEYFPQALVALAALLGLVLWHVGMRHGPIQAPAPKARRQLREHLQASAHFLLRHTGQQGLVHSLRQDILRRAQHRHPGFEHLPPDAQWQVLARLTRQPDSAISQALAPASAQRLSSADFSRLVTHLQTIRNAL